MVFLYASLNVTLLLECEIFWYIGKLSTLVVITN